MRQLINRHYSDIKDILAYCPDDGILPEEYGGSRPPIAISICYQQVNAIIKSRSLFTDPNVYKNRKARNIAWFISAATALIGFRTLPNNSNLWWLCLLFLLVQCDIFANLIRFKDEANDKLARRITEQSRTEAQPTAKPDPDELF